MIYVMLAPGFEEIEAVGAIDILRRAELDVLVVGVGSPCIKGAHGIIITADITDSEVVGDDMTAIVLPGGMPGTINLEKSANVQKLIGKAVEVDALICAICAAPSILGHRGLLSGRRAVCFPGFEQELAGAIITKNAVVVDGNIITAKGPGSVFEFATTIVSKLTTTQQAELVRSALQCQ